MDIFLTFFSLLRQHTPQATRGHFFDILSAFGKMASKAGQNITVLASGSWILDLGSSILDYDF